MFLIDHFQPFAGGKQWFCLAFSLNTASGGVGHYCVFVTEVRNSRLRPYTETNDENSQRTRFLANFRHQFLKNKAYRLNIDKFWNTDRKHHFEEPYTGWYMNLTRKPSIGLSSFELKQGKSKEEHHGLLLMY